MIFILGLWSVCNVRPHLLVEAGEVHGWDPPSIAPLGNPSSPPVGIGEKGVMVTGVEWVCSLFRRAFKISFIESFWASTSGPLPIKGDASTDPFGAGANLRVGNHSVERPMGLAAAAMSLFGSRIEPTAFLKREDTADPSTSVLHGFFGAVGPIGPRLANATDAEVGRGRRLNSVWNQSDSLGALFQFRQNAAELLSNAAFWIMSGPAGINVSSHSSEKSYASTSETPSREKKSVSFFQFLLGYFNQLRALLKKAYEWCFRQASAGAKSAYKYCGTTCWVGTLLWSWSGLLAYLPLMASIYGVYFVADLFLEEVLLPCLRKCQYLANFIQGYAPSLALRLALGAPHQYANRWNGSSTGNPFSKEHFEDFIKHAKCKNGKFLDLIVTKDNYHFVRLRAKALRGGKCGIHGAYLKYEEIVESTSRTLKNQITLLNFRLHLCGRHNCGDVTGGPAFHATGYSTIPQDVGLNLCDLRVLPWYWRIFFCFNSIIERAVCGVHRCLMYGCRCCIRSVKRSSGFRTPTPVTDESGSESDQEMIPCQAHSIILRMPRGTLRLAKECCVHTAQSTPVLMLNEDAKHSPGEALQCEDGYFRFYACSLHAAQYQVKLLERKCMEASCCNAGSLNEQGLRKCPFHQNDVAPSPVPSLHPPDEPNRFSEDVEGAEEGGGLRERVLDKFGPISQTAGGSKPQAEESREKPRRRKTSSSPTPHKRATNYENALSIEHRFCDYIMRLQLGVSEEEALLAVSNSEFPPTELAPYFVENVRPWTLIHQKDNTWPELEGNAIIGLLNLAERTPNWPSLWCEDFPNKSPAEPEHFSFVNSLKARIKPPKLRAPSEFCPAAGEARKETTVPSASVSMTSGQNGNEPTGSGFQPRSPRNSMEGSNSYRPSSEAITPPIPRIPQRPSQLGLPEVGKAPSTGLIGQPAAEKEVGNSSPSGANRPLEEGLPPSQPGGYTSGVSIIRPGSTGVNYVRPGSFQVGAYTEPPIQGGPDLGTFNARCMQELVNELRGDKETGVAEPGSLKSVTRRHERLIFYVRGCDTYDIRMCPKLVGKELIQGLRHEQRYNIARWYHQKLPYLFDNRKCYAVATMSLGGPSVNRLPASSLASVEFPTVSQQTIDRFVVTETYKAEKRHQTQLIVDILPLWVTLCERKHRMLGAVWGTEWIPIMDKCVYDLVQMNTDHPHIWSKSRVQDVYEELCARFRDEFLHFDNTVLSLCGDGDRTPSFERIRFICGLSDSQGVPVFIPPNPFDLFGEHQFFLTTLQPRLVRGYEETMWSFALAPKNLSRNRQVGNQSEEHKPIEAPVPKTKPEGKTKGTTTSSSRNSSVGSDSQTGQSTGGSGADSDHVGKTSALRLSKNERTRLKKHMLTHQGKNVCLAFQTHRGCNTVGCTDAHITRDYKSWDHSIQLYFATKDGHRKQTRLSRSEASAAMSAIRKAVKDDKSDKIQDSKSRPPSPKPKPKPKKRKKVGFSETEDSQSHSEAETEKSESTSSVAADPGHSPDVQPVGLPLPGGDHSVGSNRTTVVDRHPQLEAHGPGCEEAEASLEAATFGWTWVENHDVAEHELLEPLYDVVPEELQRKIKRLHAIDALIMGDFPPALSSKEFWNHPEIHDCLVIPHNACWLRNYLKEHSEFDPECGDDHQNQVLAALETGLAYGDFQLSASAARVLDAFAPHNTKHKNRRLGSRQAYTSRLTDGEPDQPCHGIFRWKVDNTEHSWERYDYGDQLPISDIRKELTPFASLLQQCETHQCFILHLTAGLLWLRTKRRPTLSAVKKAAAPLLDALARAAQIAMADLGPQPELLTQAECDLLGMIHDLLHPNHTKDYRTTAAFPIPEFAKVALCFVRIDHSYRASLDVVIGEAFNGSAEFCIWLHIKDGHLTLLRPEEAVHYFACARVLPAVGWQRHLEAAEDSPNVYRLPSCHHCEQDANPKVFRSGFEQGHLGSGQLNLAPAAHYDGVRTGYAQENEQLAGTTTPIHSWDGSPQQAHAIAVAQQWLLTESNTQRTLHIIGSPATASFLPQAPSMQVASIAHQGIPFLTALMKTVTIDPSAGIVWSLSPSATIPQVSSVKTEEVLHLAMLEFVLQQDCVIAVTATPECYALQLPSFRAKLQQAIPNVTKTQGPLPIGAHGSRRSWLWYTSCPHLAASLRSCRSPSALEGLLSSMEARLPAAQAGQQQPPETNYGGGGRHVSHSSFN